MSAGPGEQHYPLPPLQIRSLGLQPYRPVLVAMQQFTRERDEQSPDEFWLLEHEPVYTQGRQGQDRYILNAGDIPVESIDRGGQVTYHGPGQITLYTLIDLKRMRLGIRAFVSALEEAVVRTLAYWHIAAQADPKAPGVYVDGNKIAALGLRVSRGCSYHGLTLNVDMDMTPWRGINACGLGVPVTSVREQLTAGHEQTIPSLSEVSEKLVDQLRHELGYNEIHYPGDTPTGLNLS